MKKIIGFLYLLILSVISFSYVSCVHTEISMKNSEIPEVVNYEKLFKNAPLETVLQNGHSAEVQSIAVSPDSKYIVSASFDKTVKLWHIDGYLVRSFEGNEDAVTSVAFSPDGRYIACNSGNNINIWDVGGGLVRVLRGHENKVGCVAFSPDGRYILSGSWDTTVKLWSMEGDLLRSFHMHEGNVSKVAFNNDSQLIASIDKGVGIKVYRTNGKQVRSFQADNLDSDSLLFSTDGSYLLYVEGEWRNLGRIQIRGLYDDFEHEIVNASKIESIAISSDGQLIATGDSNNVKLWNPEGKLLKVMEGRHNRNVVSVAFSPDGTFLASAGWDNTIKLWNLDGTLIRTIRGYTHSITDSLFSPDGRFFVHSSRNTIKLWDLNGNYVRSIDGHRDSIENLSIGNNGQILLSNDGRRFSLWNIDGSHIKSFDKKDGQYGDVVISPNGHYIVCGTINSEIEILSSEGDLLTAFKLPNPGSITSLSFSPDSRYFLCGSSDATVTLWNVEGKLINTFQGHSDDISSVAFSPDGEIFVSGSYDNTAKLWNIQGTLLHTFLGHTDRVTSVDLSPDGKYIASGGNDNLVKLWSIEGQLFRTYKEHTDDVKSVSFSKDGHFLASGGLDDKVVFHDLIDLEGNSIILNTFDTDEWFVQSKNGVFDCSSKGFKYIGFIRGMTGYNPQQFWDSFYMPNLLSNFYYRKGIPEADLAKVYRNVPRVFIHLDNNDNLDDSYLSVTIVAEPNENGIGELFLLHNNRVITEGSRGLDVVHSGDMKSFTVKLLEGKNFFQGAAYDSDNIVYGTSDIEIVVYESPIITAPDLYILAVGVGRYKDMGLSLDAPSKDAVEIADAFSEIADTLYNDVSTIILTNEEAGKIAITNSLKSISDKVDAEDVVIVFFAGHGYVENGQYFFLPFETDLTDLENTSVSINVFRDFLKKTPANKIVLFFDTCQSGFAVKTLGVVAMSRSIEEKRQIASLAKAQGVAIFSASSATQKAYEIPQLGNGIFTYSVLYALEERKEEISIDGKISLGKLLASVNRITRDTAYEYLKIEQSPSIYMFGDDFYLGEYE